MTRFFDNVTPINAQWLNQVDDHLQQTAAITNFGAATTLADNGPAIQSAINSLMLTGGTVFIPQGTWNVTTELKLYPNIVLDGESPFLSILDYSAQTSGNWATISGSVGGQVSLLSSVDRGATHIDLTAPHGGSVNDDFLLMSQRNALSSDGGDWQLGVATSGSSGIYYSEVLTVANISSQSGFDFIPPLVFSGYKPNNLSETNPQARASTTAQKISWVKGVKISNLGFKASTLGSTNILNFVWAKHCYVDNCHFNMGSAQGSAVSFTQSLRCQASRSIASYTAATGVVNNNFSFTPFKIISGWHCVFDNCETFNSSQSFDISYNGGANPPMFNTVKNCRSINSVFDGMTCHSGGYGAQYLNNWIIGGMNGMSIRSRATLISGNHLVGAGPVTSPNISYGIYMSDGWTQDSVVCDNYLDNFYYGLRYGDWSISDGQINGRVAFRGNTIRTCNTGAYLSHDSSWKTSQHSAVTLERNRFYDLDVNGVSIDGYLNGVSVIGNEFHGPFRTNSNSSSVIYHRSNSVDCLIEGNRMFDVGSQVKTIIRSSITDTTTFPVGTWPNANNTYRQNVAIGASYDGTSIAETTLVRSPTVTWTPANQTVAQYERTGGAYFGVATDNASVSGLYMGNTSDQRRSGLEYNNASDMMTVRTSGGYQLALSSSYFRPYNDNVLTLGNATNRWNNIYSANVVLSPPTSANLPSINGQMTFQLTSDTQLSILVKGSDGVVRTGNITLS